MNEVMKTILARRSVRHFTDQPINDDILAQIMDAALHAPSGQGRKTWRFTVVTNKEMIKKMEKAIEADYPYKGYTLKDPAVLIIPTNLRDNPFGIEDNSIAIMNIMIAAQSFGIGSVWINQIKGRSDLPHIREVLTEMGVPEDHIAYGTCVLGYPDPDYPIGEYKEKGDVVYIK